MVFRLNRLTLWHVLHNLPNFFSLFSEADRDWRRVGECAHLLIVFREHCPSDYLPV